jgi:pilus assembly protein Flp/PilA
MQSLITRLLASIGAVLADAQEKERGATATEYALLVALIAVVIAVAVGFFGSQLSDFFHNIGTTVQGWT